MHIFWLSIWHAYLICPVSASCGILFQFKEVICAVLGDSSDDSEADEANQARRTDVEGGGLSALRERVFQLQEQLAAEQRLLKHLKRQLAAEIEAKRAYERRYVDERTAR